VVVTDEDRRFIERALELASKGLGRNFPNPLVGAVVVSGGEVVAEGYYAGPGSKHAEASALERAGEKARGATVYLNLEPCCHHGMTPPCVDAIRSSGVKRVVFSHYDPDPRVRGKGAGILRAAGIEVDVGVLSEKAVDLNLPYIHNRLAGKPFVILKLASTLDGRISLGERKYITGERTREYVHYLRAWTHAVGVGIETLLQDTPRLDRRMYSGRVGPPVRVVFDYYCRFPDDYRWLKDGEETFVFCHEDCDENRKLKLEASGARVFRVEGSGGKLDLGRVLEVLYDEGITSILVEGGARIAESFIRAALFDRLVITYAPFFGGEEELPFLSGKPEPGGEVEGGLVLKEVHRFDNDFAVVYDRSYLTGYLKKVMDGEFSGSAASG